MSGPEYIDAGVAGQLPAPAPVAGQQAGFVPATIAPPTYAAPYAQGYGPLPQSRSPLQWQAYARAHLEARKPVGQLLAEMAVSGIPQPYAFGFLAQAVSQMRHRATQIVVGGLAAVAIGVAVTVATMFVAQNNGGGQYLMWWGPIIVGAIFAIYGAYLYLRIPKVPH